MHARQGKIGEAFVEELSCSGGCAASVIHTAEQLLMFTGLLNRQSYRRRYPPFC